MPLFLYGSLLIASGKHHCVGFDSWGRQSRWVAATGCRTGKYRGDFRPKLVKPEIPLAHQTRWELLKSVVRLCSTIPISSPKPPIVTIASSMTAFIRLKSFDGRFGGFTLPQGSYLVHTIPFHATVHVDNVLAADCTVSSNDGCIFVANKQILEGSNPLVRRMCGRDPLTGVFLHLPEDGETTLAMIHAMYPFPTIPIATIDLAEKAVAAAKRYGVNIARLNFETSIFEPARVIAHPIRYCAFTWNIGLRSELESASRYALVQDLTGDFSWALGVPGAMDVLAALALTQLDRREKMDAIVSRLPTNLLCFACRGGGRGGQDEMREVVKMIFGVPNPDLHHILDCEMWAGSILATSCPTSSCGQWLHRFTFSQLSVVELANAATQVPQVIHQVYFDNKQELYQTSQN